MRSSELRRIEAARAESVRHGDVPVPPVRKGWDPRTLRGEVEQVFREHRAKVFREEVFEDGRVGFR